MPLLNAAERQQRAAAKRAALLVFLREEIFTSPQIAGEVMGVRTRSAIDKTLAALEREGVIARHTALLESGLRCPLLGITTHGQALALALAGADDLRERHFEPGRLPLSVLAHTLDLQRLRLKLEAAGWQGWQYGDRGKQWAKGQARPDAVVIDSTGATVAIEVERTVKTIKRYEVVVADRLRQIKQGLYQRVIYTSPTSDIRDAIQATIGKVWYVTVAGQRVKLEQRHRDSFQFSTYDDVITASSNASSGASNSTIN